jgi:hypothetical protein
MIVDPKVLIGIVDGDDPGTRQNVIWRKFFLSWQKYFLAKDMAKVWKVYPENGEKMA